MLGFTTTWLQEGPQQDKNPIGPLNLLSHCMTSTFSWIRFSGDAVLIVAGRTVSLLDMDGKEIGKSSGYKLAELSSVVEGNTLAIGGKEIEVSCGL